LYAKYSETSGPGVVHKSEKSISLKLCINQKEKKILLFDYSSRKVTTLIEQSFP